MDAKQAIDEKIERSIQNLLFKYLENIIYELRTIRIMFVLAAFAHLYTIRISTAVVFIIAYFAFTSFGNSLERQFKDVDKLFDDIKKVSERVSK